MEWHFCQSGHRLMHFPRICLREIYTVFTEKRVWGFFESVCICARLFKGGICILIDDIIYFVHGLIKGYKYI